MYQQYEQHSFNTKSRALVEQLSSIIADYQAQDLMLTVRQLYYQAVSRDLIPNTEGSYNKVITLTRNARMAGLMPWGAFEDRTRDFEERTRWQSPQHILEATAHSFHLDHWADQDFRVFVIVEKDALSGVLAPVCCRYDVPLLAARGYPSVTTLRSFAVEKIAPAQEEGQRVVILHLGDHDPSGLDMTRDLKERLDTFSPEPVSLIRLGLNMAQIEELNPPPNPAKITDTRAADYVARYGGQSWELDALPPDYLDRLVGNSIARFIDEDLWQAKAEEVETTKNRLRDFAAAWPSTDRTTA